MGGYAASATLHGATPQAAFAGERTFRSQLDERAPASDGALIEQLDLVGRPVNVVVAEWLAAIGESWSQLTFFLFDPDSWR